MKIEYIGLLIIAVVIAIDLIRRRVNKTSKSTDVESYDFTKPVKNKVKLIWIIMPVAVAIIGVGIGAYLYLQPTKYAIDEVAFNNDLAYLNTV